MVILLRRKGKYAVWIVQYLGQQITIHLLLEVAPDAWDLLCAQQEQVFVADAPDASLLVLGSEAAACICSSTRWLVVQQRGAQAVDLGDAAHHVADPRVNLRAQR